MLCLDDEYHFKYLFATSATNFVPKIYKILQSAMNKFRLIYFLIPPIICIYYCNGSNIGIRLEVIPPCIENEKNAARFGATQLRRLHEQYQVNGTLIVDRTITGPLQVSYSSFIIIRAFNLN